MLIVEVTLFLIAKNLVGLCYSLEFVLGLFPLFFGDLVGMVLKRKLIELGVSIFMHAHRIYTLRTYQNEGHRDLLCDMPF